MASDAYAVEVATAVPPLGLALAFLFSGPMPLGVFILFKLLGLLGLGIALLLVVQAVARRLHDSGRSFWWAWPMAPVLAAFVALQLLAALLTGVSADMARGIAWSVAILSTVAYLAWVGWLPASQGKNRYGRERQMYAPDAGFML